MWVFVIGMEMATSFTHAEYFTSLYPTTGFLVNVSLLPLSLFGTLALTWFAAEVSWRARAARMADILDATPASPWRRASATSIPPACATAPTPAWA